jgi:hypothetical protein
MHLLLLLLACARPTSPDKVGSADDSGESTAPDDTGDGLPPRSCAAPRLSLVQDFPFEVLPQIYDHRHTQQGVAIGDIDGDGWLDAILAYGGGSAGFRNNGAGDLLYDPQIDVDGGPLPSGQGAALADLDGDGDLDLYLGRDRGWPAQILTNDGLGHFTAATLPGTETATMTGAFADLDGDLDLDLFVSATVTDSDGASVADGTVTTGDGDQLLFQNNDGSFTNETHRAPAEDMFGWTFQGSPIDYDQDGDLDLYLAHDWGFYIQPNRMLQNDGTGTFTRDPDCECELVQYAMGAAVGDANEDSLPDLYMTDIGGPNLLINIGEGRFADATLALGAAVAADSTSLTSWGASFLDLDQDSRMDLAMVFGQLGQPELVGDVTGTEGMTDGDQQFDVVLLGQPDGGFAQTDVGFTDGAKKRALAVGDFDRDGLPDILTAGKYFMRHWRTEGGCGPGVRVLLRGMGRNAQAIGAKVEADIGDRTITQWMLPSTTFSQNAPELYFGVGEAHQIDAFRVTWPDGSTSTEAGAEPGETIELRWGAP